jgi:hypothetical protein
MIAGLALAAAALGAACAAGGPTQGGGPGEEVPFETILDETSSGLHDLRREVIRDEAGWVRLWEQIHEGVSPRPPRPPVDFSLHMLIVVATGERRSGGFAIAVRSVAMRGDRLEVGVFETCPAPGDRVTQALTQPVEVVRLMKLTQKAAFLETKASSCP